MKTKKGVVKSLDHLGRVVIPKEIRRTLRINDQDLLEVSVENGKITIEKFHDCCTICNSMEQLVEFGGKLICHTCINQLKNL